MSNSREIIEIEMDDLKLDATSLKSKVIEQLKMMKFSAIPFFSAEALTNKFKNEYMWTLEEAGKTESQLLFEIYAELTNYNKELNAPLTKAFINAISQFLNCDNNLNAITDSLLQHERISQAEIEFARIEAWRPLVESGAAAHGGYCPSIVNARADQKLAIESQAKFPTQINQIPSLTKVNYSG